METVFFGDDDLILNTSTRVPVCICIDTSGSMKEKDGGALSRIDRVKRGIKTLYKEISSDEVTRDAAEISIVGFSTNPYVVQDFKTIGDVNENISLQPHEKGNLGLGVLKGLELLEQRKRKYKDNGIDYYQPWLIIMTDGHPTGEGSVIGVLHEAQEKVTKLESDGKLTVIPVFIGRQGNGIDLSSLDTTADEFLSGFSKKNDPVQITEDTKFREFFTWLGKSVSTITVRSDVEIDYVSFNNWDDI